ncbi:MAG: type VI secretion system-associated protein TagF [Acetobacter sp.]
MTTDTALPFCPAGTGFFGKLPSQGDFVRHGLCEATVAALDLWCRECLLSIMQSIGPDWRNAWMVAPVWHFALPAGACGPQALLGVWMPSMDRVGRCYPFMVCAQAPDLAPLLDGAAWLDQAAEAAICSVVDDTAVTALRHRLDEPAISRRLPAVPGWWTQGGPSRAPARFELACLPPATMAAELVCDNTFSHVPSHVPTEVR